MTANAASREKRAANLKSSIELLRERGIPFTTHNNGVHIVIRRGDRVWDFWGSTGKFRERVNHFVPGTLAMHARSKVTGRGVFNLLEQLEQAQ